MLCLLRYRILQKWLWKKAFQEKKNNGQYCFFSSFLQGIFVKPNQLWLLWISFIINLSLFINNRLDDDRLSIGSDQYTSNMTLFLSLYLASNCQALCPFLCLCLCVSKSLRKWTQTDTKVTFHPPPTTTTTHPPENFFWSQMKGMAKIRLFYSGDMALILPR